MNANGHVYVLESRRLSYWGKKRFKGSSPCLKIGFTRQAISQRVTQLNDQNYGGKSDWKLKFSREVRSPHIAEEAVHRFCKNHFNWVNPYASYAVNHVKNASGKPSIEVFRAPLPAVKNVLRKLADGTFSPGTPAHREPEPLADRRPTLDHDLVMQAYKWRQLARGILIGMAISGAAVIGFLYLSKYERPTPTAAQPQPAEQTICRPYTKNVVIGGRSSVITGTACKGPDGVWRLQSGTFPK